MPSLDDIPTLPPATLSGDDMIAVIDGSDRRSPRRATLSELKTFTLSGNVASLDVGTASVSGNFYANGDLFISPPTSDPEFGGQVYVEPATGYLKVSGYPVSP